MFFPTSKERSLGEVVRFQLSSSPALPTPRQLPISASTAGPQLPAHNFSGHRWTSTADLMSPVRTAGPQPPNRMPARMSENVPDRLPECMPDRMSECMPDRVPEFTPNKMPGRFQDRMPDRLPAYMPDRMSEHMSDRMPGYLEHTSKYTVGMSWPGSPEVN